jgi:hypothetical protein
MKALTILFALTTLGLGVVCVGQWRQLHHQQTQIASLHTENDDQRGQIKELEEKQVRAEQQQKELVRHADSVASQLIAHAASESNAMAKVAALQASPGGKEGSAEDEKGIGGFGKMLGKMMEDPEMKKMIQSQQKQMMNTMYSSLIKQMGLTPDEADKFKDLLSEQTMKATENAGSLFGGSGATDRAALAASMADQQKEYDAKIKDFLGDTRYAQYKDYQETIGERTQLNMFKQQTSGTENAITDQQTEQLLALMREEKKNLAASGQPVMGNNQDPATIQAMMDSDQLEKMMGSQEDINQRVYDRAKSILSPSQLDAFGQYQTNQLQMMKVGMSMAQKMFKGGNSSSGP